MIKHRLVWILLIIFSSMPPAWSQIVGQNQGTGTVQPVAGDPGVSSMVVMDRPEFRVLRDFCEPGAARRMHSHNGVTYHVFILVTGTLQLTVEGENPVDVAPGHVLYLKGGAVHGFKNTGAVTATIVEVFGKSQAPGAASNDLGRTLGLALATAGPRARH